MTPGETAGFSISVQIFEEFDGLVSGEWLQRVAEFALASQHEGAHGKVSIVIADDGTVRDLNREHRGLDESTDVLSFAFTNQGEYYGEGERPSEWSEDIGFVMPPGEIAGLGEVIISYPQAARQAGEAGHSVRQELAHLLAHGILHLLGYDHMEPDEETVMKAGEATVLSRVLEDE